MSLRTFKVGVISIHAPRVGGDLPTNPSLSMTRYFNPRPPCGGRRRAWEPSHSYRDFNPRPPCGGRRWEPWIMRASVSISIHAPRVGGDRARLSRSWSSTHFNPRPPCGGRPRGRSRFRVLREFQSTPPVWGATCSWPAGHRTGEKFQSTPPVWGATDPGIAVGNIKENFNPRPPCGGRRAILQYENVLKLFQSTPPVWGATIITILTQITG